MPRRYPEGTVLCFAYRSGRIDFGATIAKGSLIVAWCNAESKQKLEDTVAGLARHSYPPDSYLLVPGVPEAADENAAMLAFNVFAERVKERMNR